jgi:hypothetical protein
MPAPGNQSGPPAQAANTDKDPGRVCGGLREHELVDRRAGARDSAFRGFRIWGYCVAEFFHSERNHQGLDNRLIEPSDEWATERVRSGAVNDSAAC